METPPITQAPLFEPFQKIARFSRNCVISEKIDGTNAQICITQAGDFLTGSRTQWITTENDNFGFARWAQEHREELMALGPGRHYGEWWGSGIQRRYGLTEKRFSLFNAGRWGAETPPPACCRVVPILYHGLFTQHAVDEAVERLRVSGSVAAPGFMQPEGIVVFHVASKQLFKKTLLKDEMPKGSTEVA